jgi:hypothetical protein
MGCGLFLRGFEPEKKFNNEIQQCKTGISEVCGGISSVVAYLLLAMFREYSVCFYRPFR